MTKIKLGLIQMKMQDDAEINLKRTIEKIEKLAENGAQIICTSELFLSQYFCQTKDKKFFNLAEKVPGPTTDILCNIAKTFGIVIVGSFYENADGRLFNTAAVIDADGTFLGKYRKMHIPADEMNGYMENYYFEPGDMGFKVFKTKFGVIAPMICYDQWFPEGARLAALKGAHILVYPTAIGWPLAKRADKAHIDQVERDSWVTIQRSHGIANNTFVAAINRVGTESGLKFWGTSFVSDPYGEILKKGSSSAEQNLIAEIDLDRIEYRKREWPFLNERRTEISICDKTTKR
jgi:N-carbamoylputrescine amidase